MNETNGMASRRGVLRAGAAALAAGVSAVAVATRAGAQEKLAQEAVQYQKMPKDGAKCSTCVNFIAPSSCQIVAGTIDPEGWCIAYGPKA